ncbi:MAG: LLM class flavin-dependent oxidoreductase, partial [Candidatus Binataceae bacterium]
GFTLRFEPPRKHIPIFIASLNKKSVEFTARKADGWLPVMIPLNGLQGAISEFRGVAKAAGRDPKSVAVKAPGIVHVTKNLDAARAGHAGTVAFYAARMGTFYSEQLTRFGFGAEVAKIKEAFVSGGAKAGTAAVPQKMLEQLGYQGDVAGARERIAAQEEAGIDVHSVEIDAGSDVAAFEKTVQALAG